LAYFGTGSPPLAENIIVGDLILLGPFATVRASLRGERGGARSAERRNHHSAFFFDLACPFSYVAAERIERLVGDVEWVPTPSATLGERREQADALARAASLPLVWPDRFPEPVPRALRAAAYAAEIGRGARFALAASRLAFGGGFDLDKDSVLSDAAAAAGVPVQECLAAAREEWRDEELEGTATALLAEGVAHVPAVGLNGRWFDGLHSLADVAVWLRRG
jgi:2-hydroxychromene-2-carboxylate isomerase